MKQTDYNSYIKQYKFVSYGCRNTSALVSCQMHNENNVICITHVRQYTGGCVQVGYAQHKRKLRTPRSKGYTYASEIFYGKTWSSRKIFLMRMCIYVYCIQCTLYSIYMYTVYSVQKCMKGSQKPNIKKKIL